MPTVEELVVYPVKACKGISTPLVHLDQTGFSFDRQWMIIKDDNNKFVTQRQLAKLCLVTPSLPVEALTGGVLAPDAVLTLSAPGMPDLLVPLHPAIDQAVRPVLVWEWTGVAADEGETAAQWVSQYVGYPCRLVRYLGSHAPTPQATTVVGPTARPTDPEFAVGCELRFADQFPVLVATQESLKDLNSQIPAELPMERFRPNIILAGADAGWEEDKWAAITVGGGSADKDNSPLQLTLVKPRSRCKVINIDQQTAIAGEEPMDTLQRIRSGKVLGWDAQRKSWTHAVFFGWHAVPRSTGIIKVADKVSVTMNRTWL
eukprot:jgi/Chrzof1/1733/Cz10g19010.t1